MKRRWHRLVGIVAGLLMFGGLVGGGVVLAQDPQDDPLRCGGATWRGPGFIEVAAQELGMERATLMGRLRDGELLSDIAVEQGQTLDSLAEAFLAAQEEALADAVDQGYFTQEGAACRLQQLRQRVERCLAGLRWHRAPWNRVGLDTVAEMLGLPAEELKNELHQGKTIAGLAQSHGVDLGSISDGLRQAREEALAQAVEEGRITQGQADGVHRRIQRRTELCLMWPGPGPCTACPASRR
jgi:hypothetical protein